MKQPPYHRITDVKYIDAHTGEILEVIPMREFYEWDDRADKGRGAYVMVRHYQLSKEAELNPGFKG